MYVIFYNDSTGEELKLPVGRSGIKCFLSQLWVGARLMARYHADVQAWVVYNDGSTRSFPCFRIQEGR